MSHHVSTPLCLENEQDRLTMNCSNKYRAEQMGRVRCGWWIFAALALVLMFGCEQSPTWSAESRSPYDGNWVATAQTIEYSGFGTGAVETTVQIKNLHGSSGAERVLAFADGGREIDLKMNWDQPSHLLVTYKADPKILYFQVLKTSGIEISVQDVAPNAAAAVSHPSAKR
jgi:hypothetical protein